MINNELWTAVNYRPKRTKKKKKRKTKNWYDKINKISDLNFEENLIDWFYIELD